MFITPDRRQSKMLRTIAERGSQIPRSSIFDCHLSPVGRQTAIEIYLSNDFDLRSSIVLSFRLPPIRFDKLAYFMVIDTDFCLKRL